MLAYNYDPATFEFLGVKEARKDPRDPGRYLLPANATFTPAGQAPEGFVQQFDPNSDSWSSVEDNRGDAVYRKSDAAKVTVDWLGEIGDGYTSDAPSSAKDTWSGTEWVPPAPTADDVRAEAYRRIVAVYPLWEQINRNRANDGAAVMNAWIDSVRTASDAMEVDPPLDYADDQHWPDAP